LKNEDPINSQMDLSFLTDQRIEEEPLKVHCPHCLKSFRLNKVSLKSKRPQFKCPSCKSGFWFHNVGNLAKASIMAFPMEWLHQDPESQRPQQTRKVNTEHDSLSLLLKKPAPVATKACPSCGNKTSSAAAECTFCGVVFKRHELLRENTDQFKVSAKSRKLWDRIITGYEDEARHFDFISSCAEDGALDYAGQRYKKLTEALPQDAIAKKMLLFIEQLSTMKVSTKAFTTSNRQWGSIGLNLIIMLSTVVIVMGVLFPGQKNLVGLGCLALFFVMTMKLVNRVS